jgi:hypothetical protein
MTRAFSHALFEHREMIHARQLAVPKEGKKIGWLHLDSLLTALRMSGRLMSVSNLCYFERLKLGPSNLSPWLKPVVRQKPTLIRKMLFGSKTVVGTHLV